MDFISIWTICSLLTIAPAGHMLLRDISGATWVPGAGWDQKPKESDWAFSIFISIMMCGLSWPLMAVITAFRYYQTREKRAELKRTLIQRRNDDAFRRLKEAQQCLMDQKRNDQRLATAEWTNEFNAADTKRIEAIRRSRLAHEQRRIERERERIAEESMYRDVMDYSTASSCPHGHSLRFQCWQCS